MRASRICWPAVFVILACDSPSQTSDAAIASIRVEPPLLAAMRGESSTLTATAFDAAGRVIPNVNFMWSSTSSAISVVGGQVAAASAGSAVVTASAGTKSGAAHVRVSECAPAETAFQVVAQGAHCYRTVGLLVADTTRLRAFSAYPQDASGVTWTSLNTDVATVNAQGLISGLKAGTANIRGVVGAARDSLVVVVGTEGRIEFEPDSVTLAPDSSAVLLLYPLVSGHMAPATHFANLVLTNSSVIKETYANANLTDIFLLVTGAAEGETKLTYTYRNMTGSAHVRVRR